MTDQQKKTRKKKIRAEVEADGESLWPQIRQLLIFQAKLYVDAFRDLVMSPVSIVIVIIDLVQENKGEDSLFERLLGFGRKTERFINLFNQHDGEDDKAQDIDSIITQVEDRVLKEGKDSSTDNFTNSTTDNSTNSTTDNSTNSTTDNSTNSTTDNSTNSTTDNSTNSTTDNSTNSTTDSSTDSATAEVSDDEQPAKEAD